MSLIQRIDALLPQTQCGKCGHPGCMPYAQGIADGEPINKCPPGGVETITSLATLLNVPFVALDTDRGTAPSQIAYIREAECIGCTKCIQACPVDAIVGAAKLMHTVIVDECTGCDLCVAPCPVDCIDMRPLPLSTVIPIVGGLAITPDEHLSRAAKRNRARQRFEARNARLQREELQRQAERLARHENRTAKVTANGAPAVVPETGKQNATEHELALKQARIRVSMSRAQLHKSLKAFRHPPIAEQASRLAGLQQELDQAEYALTALQQALLPVALTVPTAKPAVTPSEAGAELRLEPLDKAAINRAKIQLAMRRAALNKAQTANEPTERLKALTDDVLQAENTLSQLQPVKTP